MDIYGVLKTKSASGRFVLDEMISKINAMWIDEEITEEQREELILLATTNHDNTYNPMSKTELELLARISALEEKVSTIEVPIV